MEPDPPVLKPAPAPPPDRRIQLKVKIKSLAAEAAIIKREEARAKRLGWGDERAALHDHRVNLVRPQQRLALLVYGFIRGRHYRQIEARAHTKPNANELWKLRSRFDPHPIKVEAIEGWLKEEPLPKPTHVPKPKQRWVKGADGTWAPAKETTNG